MDVFTGSRYLNEDYIYGGAGKRKAKRAKSRSRPRTRSRPRSIPWAFIDTGYRILASKEGKEFLFAYDNLASPSTFNAFLRNLVSPTTTAPQVSDTIKDAYLQGHVLSFNTSTGLPTVQPRPNKEAVNGVLHEIPKGTSDQLDDYLRKDDSDDWKVKRGTVEVLVPGKGKANAFVILRDPPAAGTAAPLIHAADLKEIIDSNDWSSAWKEKLRGIPTA
jgi:hypothetical protein